MLNLVTQKAEAHLTSLIVVFHITQAEELMSRTGLKLKRFVVYVLALAHVVFL